MKKTAVLLALLLCSMSFSYDFNGLLESAFKNNKEIASAEKGAAYSKYEVKAVKSLYYPEIEAGYFKIVYDKEPLGVFPAGTVAPIDIYFPISDDNFTNFNLTLNWLLFDFGGRHSAYKTAKKGFEAAVYKINMKKRQIAIELLDRYTQASSLKAYLTAVNNALDTVNTHLKNIEEFRKEGLVPKSDILRIKALKLKIESEKTNIEGKLKIVAKDIERITGVKVNPEQLQPLPDIELSNDPVKLAEENREELKLLKTESEVYKLKAKIEKSVNLPKLVAKVEYSDMTNSLNPVKSNTTYYLGIKFKLFDGMKSRYQRKGYLKLSEKSENLLTNAKDKIRIQLENEIETLNTYQKQCDFLKMAYQTAKENLRVVKLQFDEHIVSSVDLKDAITDLKQNEADFFSMKEKVKAQKLKILWLSKKLEGVSYEK